MDDLTWAEIGEVSVSNYGDIKIGKRKLKHYNSNGYKMVRIGDELKYVHRLVAEAFIPNPENKPAVNHKDGNKSNCCASNLEWVTNQENALHAHLNGLNGIASRKKLMDNPLYHDIRIMLMEMGMNVNQFCVKCGMSREHFYSVFRNNSDFRVNEMLKMRDVLGISNERMIEMFDLVRK